MSPCPRGYHCQSQGGDESVDDEQFVAHVIAIEPRLAVAVDDPAEQGRQEADRGDESVAGMERGEKAEEEESEEGSVCVGGYDIDGVDDGS